MIKKGILKHLVGNRPSAICREELGSFIKQNSTNCLEEKEIKHLEEQLDQALKDYEELQKRIEKAIEYIEYDLKSFMYSAEYKTLIKILKGEEQ